MATSSKGDKGKDAENRPESADEEADAKDEAGEEERGEEDAGEDQDEAGDGDGAEDAAAKDGDEGEAAEEEAPAPKPSKAGKPGLDKALHAGPNDPAAVGAAPSPTAGLGKSVVLFLAVVLGLSVLMVLLGNEHGGGGPAAPKWKDGEIVDLNITLISTDKQDLACASGTEVGGLHCAYESQGKRWSKGDAADDKKTLRPYSTTDGVNFLAAGVWSDPALAPDKLPNVRFAVKCKLTVAGKMPRADVRWREGEAWNSISDWYVGAVADCKMGPIQN